MTQSLAAVIAALFTVWAALLGIAGEAPGLGPSVGDPPPDPGKAMPLARALRLARMTTLTLAATAVGFAATWWTAAGARGLPLLAVAWLLLLLTADVLPRALGGLAPAAAGAALPAARASLMAFRPLLGIVHWADQRAHRLLPPSAEAPGGRIGAAQRDMLLGVFSLEDTTIEDVMTPRLDVVAVDAGAPWSEVVDVVRQGEHSRVPVFRETLDEIAGVLHAKDLASVVIGTTAPPDRWQDLVRPVPFVPESKSLAAQLRDFQRGAGHLAIVVDEFGGTSGLVTLEDILEEIVGEIHDEYDEHEEPEIEREGNEKFWVNGRVTLDDLSAALGRDLTREEVSTVGGLIYAELGRVPRPGEELRLDGFRVVVEQVLRRRVQRVYFERLEPVPVIDGVEPASGEPA